MLSRGSEIDVLELSKDIYGLTFEFGVDGNLLLNFFHLLRLSFVYYPMSAIVTTPLLFWGKSADSNVNKQRRTMRLETFFVVFDE